MARVTILMIALVTAMMAATGCGTDERSAIDPWMAGRGPDTLIIGRPADAIALDPARVSDNESVEVIAQIYETLLGYDRDTNTIIGVLATGWTVSEDGRVWNLTLREGVLFHDGTPFNAEAVVFSLDRQRDPGHPQHHIEDGWNYPYSDSILKNIVSVRAVEELSVEITIQRSYAPFAANLTMFSVGIVSPAAVREGGNRYGRRTRTEAVAPVGTGPYKFVTWSGGRVVLGRNDAYWGARANIRTLVFASIPDAHRRLVSLQSGAIDVAYSPLPEDLPYARLHPELAVHRAAVDNVAYLAFNTAKAPMDQLRLRRAANYAINKEPIVKLSYQGLAIPAQGPLPPTQWAHVKGAEPYPYRPDMARVLVEQVVQAELYDGRELTFLAPTTPRPYLPEPERVARILQASLERVGIATKLVLQPFDKHLADIRAGRHDMALHGWVGDNGDPDNFLYTLFSQDNAALGTARNIAFFSNAEVETLLKSAQEKEDRASRERFYLDAQHVIQREAPWAPIAHTEVVVVSRRDVLHLDMSPTNNIDYKHVARARQ